MKVNNILRSPDTAESGGGVEVETAVAEEASPEQVLGATFEGIPTSQVASLYAMGRTDKSVLNDPETKALLEKYQDALYAAAKRPAKEATPAAAAKAADENKGAGEADEEDGEPEKQNTGRFGNKQKAAPIAIKDISEFPTIIKDRFGIDTTKDDYLSTTVNTIEKWRSDSSKFTETEAKLNGIQSRLQELPEDIAKVIQIWDGGGDYKRALEVSTSPIDYEKKFSDQDPILMIKTFMPEQDVTQEDLSDKNDPATKILLTAVEKLYNSQASNFKTQKQQLLNEGARLVSEYKSSVSASMSALKSAYDGFEASDLKKIENILSSRESILSMFVDKNGKLLPDAAEKLSFALYGKEEIGKQVAATKSKAKTEANETKVAKLPDRANPIRSTTDKSRVDPNTEKMIKDIEKLADRKIRFT